MDLEQVPAAQAALLAIDNASGEIKAMVGGYDFEESKFNRATQAMRQTGSSFKVYVYSDALEMGMTPFDTIVDAPVTFRSGGQNYSPRNYDEKFEGRITLRRALADSRNVPAVRLLDHVGVLNVVDLARRFGITSPLPPYLPLALGAADLTLMEHTSAFTVFPDDGIHIEPHYIRRVTSYDGAVLEEPRPNVTDVMPPDVARTMVAMLEDVVQFGTGVRAKELGGLRRGRPERRMILPMRGTSALRRRLPRACGWVTTTSASRWARKKPARGRRCRSGWSLCSRRRRECRWKISRMWCRWKRLRRRKQVLVDVPDTAPPADAAEQGLAPAKAPVAAPVSTAPHGAKPAPKLAPPPKTISPTSAPAPARVTALASPHS